MKVYKAAKGARFNDKQAQVYGEYLEGVASEMGGVDPRWLADNRCDSPINFEEDDAKAASEFRVLQAYDVLRHIEVEVQVGEETQQIRAFFPITVKVSVEKEEEQETFAVKARVYKDTESIMNDPEMRSEIVSDALDRFRMMRNKYRHIVELSKIFEAIDNTKI